MESLSLTSDKSCLDIPLIHDFLTHHSGWAKGISVSTVEKSIQNSLCFAGFLGTQQICFARVISDQATFAYLADVFVLPPYRGKGYSKQLMQYIMTVPELQNLRRFMLATSDAHGLYLGFGFSSPVKPDSLMECYHPDIYQKII